MVYGAGRGGDLVNLSPAVAIGFVGLDCVSLVDSYCVSLRMGSIFILNVSSFEGVM